MPKRWKKVLNKFERESAIYLIIKKQTKEEMAKRHDRRKKIIDINARQACFALGDLIRWVLGGAIVPKNANRFIT